MNRWELLSYCELLLDAGAVGTNHIDTSYTDVGADGLARLDSEAQGTQKGRFPLCTFPVIHHLNGSYRLDHILSHFTLSLFLDSFYPTLMCFLLFVVVDAYEE